MAWIDPYPNLHRRKRRKARRTRKARLTGSQRRYLQKYRAKGRKRDARGRFS